MCHDPNAIALLHFLCVILLQKPNFRVFNPLQGSPQAITMSELVWGIKNGDIEQVKDIVENKQIDVNAPIDGRVPLHYAADYGQTAVLNFLLDKGADPNMIDKHGISVILAAIWEGHTDCVRTLLKHGASKTGKTPDGTPYIEAAEKDEIKDLLT